MWNKKKVAVILPTYKEKESIYQAIQEFGFSGFVDEIIVVDNNAEEGTVEQVRRTKARLINERKQGYGYAIRKGLASTKADLMIVAEPDGTFDGRDVVKLLAYSDNFDLVLGSRTHRPLIQKGSDMTLLKRIGDVMLAKLINLLFLCYPLTDLGCTLRLTSQKAWRQVSTECRSSGGIFATEWVVVAAKNKVKFVEIPINFKGRVGVSTLSPTLAKKIIWGWDKFVCIWKVWLCSRMGRKL